MLKNGRLPLAIVTLLSVSLYVWSANQLGTGLDLPFIALLSLPAALYFWFYRKKESENTIHQQRTAWILIVYGIIYFISIFIFPILGASVLYWLVQFLVPLVIMKLLSEPLSGLNFKWTDIFADIKYVGIAMGIVVPFLVFMVRDTEQIIYLFQTWKIAIYLPMAVIFMLVIAAFWEEFFFRGIIMSGVYKLTDSTAVAVFSSALLFSTYHIPMRYLNEKSQHHGDLLASIAATLNEQFLMGLLMGIIVFKSKNVWHAIWIHSVLNGVSYIYKLSLFVKF